CQLYVASLLSLSSVLSPLRPPRRHTLFPYTTLFRSGFILRSATLSPPKGRGFTCSVSSRSCCCSEQWLLPHDSARRQNAAGCKRDRKSTRLNSSHVSISYAVFCL